MPEDQPSRIPGCDKAWLLQSLRHVRVSVISHKVEGHEGVPICLGLFRIVDIEPDGAPVLEQLHDMPE